VAEVVVKKVVVMEKMGDQERVEVHQEEQEALEIHLLLVHLKVMMAEME
jgi:hypothetical protein